MPSIVLALALLLSQASEPSAAPSISGVVVDQEDRPVRGARITASDAPDCATTTASDGRFVLDCARLPGRLQILAPGFRALDLPLDASAVSAPLRLLLQPARHTETVVVTATRAEGQTVSRASPVSVLDASELMTVPPAPLDDLLRRVPGFSLFRRSSSRVSNPTTQGATLRGLSASGASRALVLADGLALNDPFGGWVAWNRVPAASVERVEVVRGGASDLYGADALAGVVQILTVRPTAPVLRAEITGGSRGTGRASVFAGTLRRSLDLSVSAEASTTDGYVLVSEPERGAVDTAAGGRYATGRAGVGYTDVAWYARGGGNVYTEDRENGTPLQTNDTGAWQARAESGGELLQGRWRVRLHGVRQTYRQSFSSIAADRSAETLTLRQRVPAREHGLAADWSRAGTRLDWLVGGDLRETTATNHEQGYFPDGRARPATSTDAFQRTSGMFAQATGRPRDDLTLTVGARGDLRERDRTNSLGDADANVSPRATAAWTLTPQIVVRGSAAWSFRAPTLNERFRGFRVGNVVTLPNPDLRPETLRTIEAGVFLAPRHGSLRATVFRSDLDDGVANVTLSTTPALITRRRENVGGIRVLGLELETDWQLAAGASLTAAAAILDSRFVDDPQLTGLRVPQVPRWQASTGVRWLAPADVAFAGQFRIFGPQFEDDLNTLTLDSGAVLDISATRPFGRGLSLLASVENLFDASYDVGRTPVRTEGLPFTAFAGVRLDLRR